MKTSRIVTLFVPLVFATPAFAQGTDAQRAACSGDAFRLCASSIPNVAKISACMRERRAELSAGCRTVMDEGDRGNQRTAAAPPPAPRIAEKPRPAERVAAAPKAPATKQNERVARRPAPATRQSERREAMRPVASPRIAEARKITTPRPEPRAATAPARSETRQAGIHRVTTRRAYAGRRTGNSDMAQAMYWMHRVTGYSGGLPSGFAGLIQ